MQDTPPNSHGKKDRSFLMRHRKSLALYRDDSGFIRASINSGRGYIRRRFVPILDQLMRQVEQKGWSGKFRLVISLLFYGCGSVFCFWLACVLRTEFATSQVPDFWLTFWSSLFWILPLKLTVFMLYRLFDGLLAYFSLPDILRLGMAILTSSALIVCISFLTGGPSRVVLLLDLLLCLVVFCAFRMALRMSREAVSDYRSQRIGSRKKVVVVGAGEEGAILVRELLNRPSLGMTPIFFLDDVKYRWQGRIHGIPVLGGIELLREKDIVEGIDEVLFSDSQMDPDLLRKAVQRLNKLKISYRKVTPFLREMGDFKPGQPLLKPLELSDFLQREQAQLDTEGLRHLIEDKVVMITGAGGSIGSELVRQVALRSPKRLVLVERSEASLFLIQQEIQSLYPTLQLHAEVADICNEERIGGLLKQVSPDIIYHAAAHKHVPMMETQPAEALYNNSLGTYRLALQGALHGVPRFVLISTDKAVKPSSVMGATKRLAELSLLRLQSRFTQTRFMMVRFGNVLGSSGSVIPIFERQIKNGGPVTVTDPEVTRYFMTIPEAVGLVLQCSLLGQGGEIFSLDMGRPIKIVDLARQLIEFYGYRADVDIQIRFSGLRLGEKLHEELAYSSELMENTAHEKVFQIRSQETPDDEWWTRFEDLIARRHELSATEIVGEMQGLLPEYKPAYNKQDAVSTRD
jgi:FlaA1/EpsC-like NDP-sugar epimerase